MLSSLLPLPLERQNIPDGCIVPCYPRNIQFPEIPPNEPNSERTHPPATSGIVYIYLLAPPTPAQHPCPIIHPALPSGTLGISTTPPVDTKDPITNPNHPGSTAKVLFFGWWGIPGVDWSYGLDKSWVLIYQGSIYRCPATFGIRFGWVPKSTNIYYSPLQKGWRSPIWAILKTNNASQTLS